MINFSVFCPICMRGSAAVSSLGVVLGVAFLVSAAIRAYRKFPETSDDFLGYLRVASQATVGACLVYYFALGKLRQISFAESEICFRDTAHARPGFTKVGKNPVLARYLRK